MSGSRRNGRPAFDGYRVRKVGDDVFSTGQVAALCGVSSRTVFKWVDSGSLKGYRIPAAGPRATAGDRRVCREDLVRFAREHGLTRVLAVLEAGRPSALACGVPGHVLPPGVNLLPCFFALGEAVGECRPHAVLLGTLHGRAAALEVSRLLRLGDDPPRVVGVAAEDDGDPTAWMLAGCAAVLRLPCPAGDVAAALGEGVGG